MKKKTGGLGMFFFPIIILFLIVIYLEMAKGNAEAYNRIFSSLDTGRNCSILILRSFSVVNNFITGG